MATSNQFYKCGRCEKGLVKRSVKATITTVSVSVGNCNKCKASYGIKGVEGLEKIATKP